MPHTSRRKKAPAHAKRHEIVDEEGWTRVITTTAKSLQNLTLVGSRPKRFDDDDAEPRPKITPTDVPKDTTLEALTTRFRRLQQQWLASSACTALNAAIKTHCWSRSVDIQSYIFLGSGTFSGYKAGWIGRHDVALLQLAVFVSILDSRKTTAEVRPSPAFAQEPLYNMLDHELLRSLDIEVLDDPAAMSQISDKSLVYAPGAEREVALAIYSAEPAVVLSHDARLLIHAHGSVVDGQKAGEEGGAVALQAFLDSHERLRLPNFDMANEPFRDQYLHYKTPGEDLEDDTTTPAQSDANTIS